LLDPLPAAVVASATVNTQAFNAATRSADVAPGAKASDDITGKIQEEKELVEKHGGRLGFTTGQVFSSTKLINTAMSGLSDEVRQFMLDFKTRHTMKEIRDYAEVISRLKVLVVGDVIIDKYTYCHVQGMMTKDMGYSSRLSCSEEYLGGAVAIARHLSSFTDDVTLMSVIGNEEGMRLRLFDELSDRIQLRLTCSSTVPTIVKHRYLTRNDKREEYRKVFAINNIPENVRYEDETYREFREKLESRLAEYDVVFVCDFGHGLINPGESQVFGPELPDQFQQQGTQHHHKIHQSRRVLPGPAGVKACLSRGLG
jgi:hypothetical protein